MSKILTALLLSLCTLCGAATATQPAAKESPTAQKALEKAQRKKLKQEIRRFERQLRARRSREESSINNL